MINKIMPVSFKGNTETKVATSTEAQQVVTTPVAQTESQVDTFTNTIPKKSGNGSLLTGILGLMEMVNMLLSMTTKK